MQALGHQVSLVCPEQASIYREAQKQGLPVTALAIERKSLKSLLALGKWLRTQTIDVINTHSSTDSWLVALARAIGWYKGGIVRTRHVSAPIKPTISSRWLYTKGCDFVVTTGEKLRHQVIEQTKINSERVRSIPTGIDLNKFNSGNKYQSREVCLLPQDKIIIGIVATLRSWKGHRYLVEAIAQLKNPNILILIVGEGPNRPNIEAAIQTNHLMNQVYFAGNQVNVVPWLQTMDLFVLPSYANEGVPQSLMQAMACGIPVISTPVGSISELVQDRKTGRLVPIQDSTKLAEVINELVTDKEQSQQLVQQGLMAVRNTYALPIMLNHMQEAFVQVVN